MNCECWKFSLHVRTPAVARDLCVKGRAFRFPCSVAVSLMVAEPGNVLAPFHAPPCDAMLEDAGTSFVDNWWQG